jgi:hypothetical protein
MLSTLYNDLTPESPKVLYRSRSPLLLLLRLKSPNEKETKKRIYCSNAAKKIKSKRMYNSFAQNLIKFAFSTFNNLAERLLWYSSKIDKLLFNHSQEFQMVNYHGTGYYGPNHNTYFLVGIIGTVIFIILSIWSIFSYTKSINRYVKFMFMNCFVSTVFEIPRYVFLIKNEAYTNKIGYVLHMLASVFFFVSFSCVCYLLNDIIDISTAIFPIASSG